MKKIYHLSTCNTCQRILKELGEAGEFDLQDIKTDPISEAQLEEMRARTDSYESLFSRRARKFRAMGLHERELSEADYRQLLLEEYTFLKRPVVLIGQKIFIGNAKKTVAAAKAAL